MTVSAYSTTAGSNVSINGISIAEGMPRNNVNDAIRNIMADIKTWTNTYGLTIPVTIAQGGTGQITASAAFGAIAASGGTVGGNIVRSGKGVHAYWNSSSYTGGKMFLQAIGAADPTTGAGDILFEY